MPPQGRDRSRHTPDRHFRIPEAEYGAAKAKAAREGHTITWIVRHALRLYLAGQLPVPGEAPPGHSEDPSPPVGTGP